MAASEDIGPSAMPSSICRAAYSAIESPGHVAGIVSAAVGDVTWSR